MRNSAVGEGTVMDKSIVAEDVVIGKNVVLGCGEEAPNVLKPAVYSFGIATVGEKSYIPDGVRIGKKYSHIRHYKAGGLSGRQAGKRTGNKGEGR